MIAIKALIDAMEKTAKDAELSRLDSIIQGNSEAKAKYEKELIQNTNERNKIENELAKAEAQFFIDLFENLDHFDDKGQLTDIGMAVMGQHAVQYEIALKEAQNCADELADIEKEFAKEENKNDTELIKRKNELIGLYQDQTLAMKDAKQEMISMVEEAINLELESLDSLIEKYKETLKAQKDLYDFNKKVTNQSKEIAKLNKILSSYENDKSQEAKARIQKIRVQLEESQNEMFDMNYDHFISERDELLSSLYKEYEEILNKRMDNVDVLFKELMQDVDKNSSKIAQTVKTETEKWGYDLSTGLEDIWKVENDTNTSINNAVDSVSASINSNGTSIKDAIGDLISSIEGKNQEDETNESNFSKTETERWNGLSKALKDIQDYLYDIMNDVDDILTNET